MHALLRKFLFRGDKRYNCNETVTYTTHATYDYLDLILPLLERWRNPVSIAVYAPGNDFENAIEKIAHLRRCSEYSQLIASFVTFHLFFDLEFKPEQFSKKYFAAKRREAKFSTNCDSKAGVDVTFRSNNSLLYPINVARNIARENAQTHFVLAADIEMIPGANLTDSFMAMMKTGARFGDSSRKVVYVLPQFEQEKRLPIPANKKTLIGYMWKGQALVFHHRTCPKCQYFPDLYNWTRTDLKGIRIKYRAGQNTDSVYLQREKKWPCLVR